jgi:hypothetical protein
MAKQDFSTSQKEVMKNWRKLNISTILNGTQSKDRKTKTPVYHDHIIPREFWKETIWVKIREELLAYINNPNSIIQAHTGTHNLVSSWVVAANLYFPIRSNDLLKKLMLSFLQQKVSTEIVEITDVELEFAFPDENELSPSNLLGETGGSRGSGQTSPDIAFIVKTKLGKGIILTECKYTEHSFYACSARRINKNSARVNNPDPSRCMQGANSYDYKSICHQSVWGRKYLNLIQFSEKANTLLSRCPAATGAYQLLRQQALAEGIAQNESFDLVASTVAFDGRNKDLISCMKTTGIEDFQKDWSGLFQGKALFKTWTHQDWVKFVRENTINEELNEWLDYLSERYGY